MSHMEVFSPFSGNGENSFTITQPSKAKGCFCRRFHKNIISQCSISHTAQATGQKSPPCCLFCTLLSEKDVDVLQNHIHFGETETPHCLQLSSLSLELPPVFPRAFKSGSLQPGSTSPPSTFLQPHTQSRSLRITKVVTRNKMKEIQLLLSKITISLKENY